MGELKKLSFDEVLSCLENVKQHGEKATARCPAHDDNKESLSIARGNYGEAVCNCFAGCAQADIFKAIYSRLNKQPEFEDDKPIKPKRTTRKVVARYDYTDENGEIINTKIRYSNKDFVWDKKGKQDIQKIFRQGLNPKQIEAYQAAQQKANNHGWKQDTFFHVW